MEREIREWKKGRKRSFLPAFVAVLAVLLIAAAWYADKAVREKAVKEELLGQLAGEYIVTKLLCGAKDMAKEPILPMALVITGQGGLILDGEELFSESKPAVKKLDRREKKEFGETFADLSPELTLERKVSYIITFSGEGTENTAIYYADSGIWFTPHGRLLYELKKQ